MPYFRRHTGPGLPVHATLEEGSMYALDCLFTPLWKRAPCALDCLFSYTVEEDRSRLWFVNHMFLLSNYYIPRLLKVLVTVTSEASALGQRRHVVSCS